MVNGTTIFNVFQSCDQLPVVMTVTVKMSKDITPQSLKNAERNMGPRLK